MINIGVLIEMDEKGVKEVNYGLVAAARENGTNCVYALILEGVVESAKQDLEAHGIEKIVSINANGGSLPSQPDLQAEALIAAIEEFSLTGLIGLSSAKSRDILARLAANKRLPLFTDCVEVSFSEKTVRKSHFSGKTVATIACNAEVMLCAIRPNTIEPILSPTEAELIQFSPPVSDSGKVEILEVIDSDSNELDLTEASIIITGGRPIGSSANFTILEQCAKKLGAVVGASRAAVDAGFAPHSMQIGQTGKTVSPKLYIACGLSGSVQHFAGMRTSKIIIAINTDKDAPIFSKSDYGIIGDLFELVPAITDALDSKPN
jgi:electron transfer flavoprotein alpha subunit